MFIITPVSIKDKSFFVVLLEAYEKNIPKIVQFVRNKRIRFTNMKHLLSIIRCSVPVFWFYYLCGIKNTGLSTGKTVMLSMTRNVRRKEKTADKKFPSAVISAPMEKVLLRNTAVAVCTGGKLSVIKL